MKIAVIGAGIQGICTAYELASQGHRVHVFDRNSSAAEEASFANGSLMSACVMSSMLDHVGLAAALRAKFKSPSHLHWNTGLLSTWRWARQTRKLRLSPTGASRRKDLQDLAQFSREQFTSLCNTLRLDMDHSEGILLLMRGPEEQAQWASTLRELAESEIEATALDAVQAREIETALREDTPLHQAVLLREDGSANCRQFALALKLRAEEMGVEFHLSTEVLPWHKQSAIQTVRTPNREHGPFDAVVVCAGEHAQRLIQSQGIRPVLQRMQGYSISAAVREPLDAPKSAVFDVRHQVSIARMGQRVRVSGAYTIGKNNANPKQRLELLYKVLDDWFPGAARTHDNPQIWQSAVIGTTDGLPIVGKTAIPGLWLNMAHGMSGWTTACGCARLIADQISGKATALEASKFNLARWHR